jgi:hypothetical protein
MRLRYVCARVGIFTEPLPSKGKGTFSDLMRSNDEGDTHARTIYNIQIQFVPQGNILRLHYKVEPVNAVRGNSRCLL